MGIYVILCTCRLNLARSPGSRVRGKETASGVVTPIFVFYGDAHNVLCSVIKDLIFACAAVKGTFRNNIIVVSVAIHSNM